MVVSSFTCSPLSEASGARPAQFSHCVSKFFVDGWPRWVLPSRRRFRRRRDFADDVSLVCACLLALGVVFVAFLVSAFVSTGGCLSVSPSCPFVAACSVSGVASYRSTPPVGGGLLEDGSIFLTFDFDIFSQRDSSTKGLPEFTIPRSKGLWEPSMSAHYP